MTDESVDGDVQWLEKRLDAMDTQFSTMTEKLDSLLSKPTQELTTAQESKISELQTSLQNLQTQKTLLEEKLAKMEANLPAPLPTPPPPNPQNVVLEDNPDSPPDVPAPEKGKSIIREL